ncbi:hypothetical protein EVAR_71511_1 [Eumeta japonica]|uniref:Uncharacterized protein n=1 Tax=Eumeta variegata TaxID=151549 RepID=A0A4C2AEB9_EUMVA|nr:hypothetical protein EVAR_71511_1 [Eumeta japonica]
MRPMNLNTTEPIGLYVVCIMNTETLVPERHVVWAEKHGKYKAPSLAANSKTRTLHYLSTPCSLPGFRF